MYKFIYKPTGNAVYHYETWREAQEVARQFIDDKCDENYLIQHQVKTKILGNYELKDFVARTQPDNFTLDITPDFKPKKDLESERFHHLDDKETAEVLKYTPTGSLIAELVRRAGEYESTIASIREKLDSMKVYDIKH